MRFSRVGNDQKFLDIWALALRIIRTREKRVFLQSASNFLHKMKGTILKKKDKGILHVNSFPDCSETQKGFWNQAKL